MNNCFEYNGPSEFCHLHCHTVFSTLDGVMTPEQLVNTSVDRGWPAVCVTEHGHLASVPDMYFAANKKNIKYIPGSEIYYNDFELYRQEFINKGNKIKDIKNEELYTRVNRNRHLTVIAKNEIGFKNLTKLTTEAYEIGFYRMPRIWFDRLDEYREGLIILSGCLNGPISYEINNKNITGRDLDDTKAVGAIEYILRFKEIFGDDYYIELQMPVLYNKTDFKDHMVFWALNSIANKYDIQKTLTNDCHYLNRIDFQTQKLMMAINQNTTINDPNLFHVNSDEQYLKTRAELWDTFKRYKYSKKVLDNEFEDMCDGTLMVADKCDTFNPDTSPKIPSSEDDTRTLKLLVAKALKKKNLDKDTNKYYIDNRKVTYVEQAQIELNRFVEKGFSSYFIITKDLIDYSLSQGWPVGPRGCTIPNSMVSTTFGQTEIEKINVGDNVIDGFGDTQTVENKFIYDVAEELYKFELEDGRIITITCDHKLYIIRDNKVLLLKASEIKDTDEIIDTSEVLCPSQQK